MANGTVNNTPGGARRSWIAIVLVVLLLMVAVGAYVELRPHRIRVSVVYAGTPDHLQRHHHQRKSRADPWL